LLNFFTSLVFNIITQSIYLSYKMTKEAKSNFRNAVTHNVLTSLGSSNKK